MGEPTADGQEYAIPPDEFATLVSGASDDQLLEGLEANRELIVDGIFQAMPTTLNADRTGDTRAVIEWRIREGPGGGPERYQVSIDRGTCVVERDGSADPDVTYELGALDLVKLAAGSVQGPALFVFGKLKVRGNLLLAAKVPAFFRVPRAD